ncbi:DUF805 domain-containing protein [Pseudomonas xionganensis]|uniref:DUF805 domain-containing protein n=1 Tax=Pseudomonas xionganensis TaxID=2654845 RepID=A0A6I4KSX8_9PSED|nr:DUF805 domain-containing protein [Pseudomonas xionganensis]MVW73692.1 DUF805 domain-containing protein [Pseudomonas xionganensis]
MSQPRFKIVFSGELMPDVGLETTKDNLARLFKSDMAKIEALFSGSPIEIKRNLSETEADHYLSALQRAGAKVRKEQDLAASLSLVATDDHPDETQESTTTAEPSTMTCPKCGHEQATAVACSACGIVIEKYLARQAQLATSAATPNTQPEQAANPYSTPKTSVAESLPEFGELKPFGIQGRIGRLRYLAWSMVLVLACLPLFGIAAGLMAVSELLGGILMAALGIGVMVVGIMFGVQRLHDIGWSGWLLLLTLVPVVGGVFSLLLFIIPGSTDTNRYGPPPPPNSMAVKVLAWLWLGVIIAAIVAAIALPALLGLSGAH